MPPPGGRMRLAWAGLSDPGRQRAENQDAVRLPAASGEASPLFLLADGMGGARGGREASRLALETAARAFAAAPPGQPLDQALATAFQAANAAVHQKAQRDPALAGMGTTLVALACREGRGVAANVGDSRLYLLRWGELRQISRDHGLVAEQVRQGRLSPAEARHHALRNVLTRALGVAPELEVDLFPLTLRAGDIFLLCSDGLHGPVEDTVLAGVLAGPGVPAAKAARLVELANQAGGPDNVSAVLVTVEAPGGPPPRRGVGAPGRWRRAGPLLWAAGAGLLAWLAWLALGGWSR